MNRKDVEAMLDLLASNHNEGWDFYKETDCHIFIHNKKFKKPPHCRIRKDNGMLECLNGIKFYLNGTNTGLWRMPCEEFVKFVTGKYHPKPESPPELRRATQSDAKPFEALLPIPDPKPARIAPVASKQ